MIKQILGKKINPGRCPKCGHKRKIKWLGRYETINDNPPGLTAKCRVCGFEQKIKALDE